MYKIYDYKLRKVTKGEHFSHQGKKYTAKVVSVYDGDTCTVIFRYRGVLQQHNIRLLGIDTPELKPRLNIDNRDEEIRKAKLAKQELEKLINGKIVHLYCHNFDNFGRILAVIKTRCKYFTWKSSLDINKYMLDNNFAITFEPGGLFQ